MYVTGETSNTITMIDAIANEAVTNILTAAWRVVAHNKLRPVGGDCAGR